MTSLPPSDDVSGAAASDVAIIGMACRLPGAADYRAFRRNLRAGVESVTRFTAEELIADGCDPALVRHPDYVPASAMLDGIDRFDAAFFGYSPREAQVMDPQQRLFLEVAYEAFEDAGHAATDGAGVAVFAGGSTSLYLLHNLQFAPEILAQVGGLGLTLASKSDFLPLRVAHRMNLRGPTMNVQTGCSTALTAVHLAVQSLLSGESRMALAGAVSVNQLRKGGYLHQPGAPESRSGHCRAFDAAADGMLRGSGVGAVLLKRLGDALADGDHIHAVIKGSACNNDGAEKIGFTAPSENGQTAAIAEALSIAGVPPDRIGCIEAHGTGTALGDPIEIAALTRAFRRGTDRRGYCAVGSVKTNMGHLDAAAGMAGLIKAVLSLEHGELYPSLHFERPNPEIDFDSSPFFVNTVLRPWTPAPQDRFAGVNSFGMGGTNTHIVLQGPPAAPARAQAAAGGPAEPVPLLLSARSPQALTAAAARLADHLDAHPDQPLADVAHTLRHGRRPFTQRLAVIAASHAEAAARLRGVPAPSADPQDAGGTKAAHAAALWMRGEMPDWPSAGRRRVPLPSYPFERDRHWVDPQPAPVPSFPAGPTAGPAAAALYSPVWSEAAITPLTDATGAWLMVEDGAGLAGRLADRLHARTGARARVMPAGRLSGAAAGGATVLHIGTLDGGGAELPDLTRSLAAVPHRPIRLLIVTSATAAVLGDEAIDVERATHVALALAQNAPADGFHVSTLDLALGPAPAAAWTERLMDSLLDEAAQPAGPPAALRGRRRWIARPEPLPEPTVPRLAVGADGTYAVTGAFGPLGWSAATALVEAGARSLLLVDRHPLPDAANGAAGLGGLLQRLDADAGPWTEARRPPALTAALDALCAAYSRRLLEDARLDLRPGRSWTLAEIETALPVEPAFRTMLASQLDDLVAAGVLRWTGSGDGVAVTDAPPAACTVAAARARILADHPDHEPLLDLLDHCATHTAAVLAGRLPATAVVASDTAARLFQAAAPVIGRHSARGHALRVVSALVRRMAEAAGRPLRILEVGGGTGALTHPLLEALRGVPVDYVFTDIATLFLTGAQREAARKGHGGVTVRRLDITADPLAQGFAANSVDLVLGLDVVHATRDAAASLRNLCRLLRPGGTVALVELIQRRRWVDRIWGLETGWWHFADGLREHTPVMDLSRWRTAAERAGLTPVATLPERTADIEAADTGLVLMVKGAMNGDDPLTEAARADDERRRGMASAIAGWRGTGIAVEVATAPDTRPLARSPLSGLIDTGPARRHPGTAFHLMVTPAAAVALAAGHAALAAAADGGEDGNGAAMAWTLPDGATVTAGALRRVLAAGRPLTAGDGTGSGAAPVGAAAGAAMPSDASGAMPNGTTGADPSITDPVAASVASVWADLLGVPSVGLDDDFYDLGGDSLITTRIIALLHERHGVELPAQIFFEATTVREMAAALSAAMTSAEERRLRDLVSSVEGMSEEELEAELRKLEAEQA